MIHFFASYISYTFYIETLSNMIYMTLLYYFKKDNTHFIIHWMHISESICTLKERTLLI